MKPAACPACGGAGKDLNTTRRLPCQPCSGQGFVYVEGEDVWAGYRAHWKIAVTPHRLALEESLTDAFD